MVEWENRKGEAAMPRNVYTPEFKARVVIEVLEGARELEAIAAEYQLNPNMVRNWKAEFLQNAGRAFEQPDKKNGERRRNGRKRMSVCSEPWAN